MMETLYQDYYTAPGAREVCHALKHANCPCERETALRISAAYLSGTLGAADGKCFLVPAPQSRGRAEYTLDMCMLISAMTGAKVLDVIRCVPHEPLYAQKQKGKDINRLQAEFYLADKVPEIGRIFLVDNVIATGETYTRISRLFNRRLIPLVYAVDYKSLKDRTILETI